jgi:hypothetical protein
MRQKPNSMKSVLSCQQYVSCKFARMRFLPWILLIYFLLPPGQVFAQHFSVASRAIFNASNWPLAYRKALNLSTCSYQLQSLNRLIYSNHFSNFRLKFEVEMAGTHTSDPGATANWQTDRRPTGFKRIKSDSILTSQDHHRLSSEIERLEISFSYGKFDFQIGRQPVSFGTSHFVSVMDILSPFHPGYLDGSYKPGIDALRIRTLAGTTGEAELIFAAGENSADNAVIGRWRDTFSGFDFEFTGGRFRSRNFFAAGWEGERRSINFWGEVGFFTRKSGTDTHFGGISDDFAISFITGIEKDTGNDWRHGLAFFHQDFGTRRRDELPLAYQTGPLKQGWMHLAGSDYLIINSSKEISPLINLNLNSMLSLIDRSLLFQPVLNISLDDESDISIFAWLNSGSRPTPAPLGLVGISTEFGAFPSGAGFILRRFF